MLIFTLMSLEMLRPFIPANAREEAWWDVWVQQVFILQSLMKPSHTYQDLLDLDITIHNMFTRFEEVPEYRAYWVPKLHFAQHSAMDILRFGPMRLNWCMMYEAKNQPMKKGCRRGNFHNTGKTTTTFWADSTEHELRKRVPRTPIVSAGPVKQEGKSDKFPGLAVELTFMQQTLQLEPDATFKMLRSASKYGVQFFTATYAIIAAMPGVPANTICRIQHMIMTGNTISFIVDVFPPEVISFDDMGVMETTTAELNQAETTHMVLDLATDTLTALWHYPRENDNKISFIAKW